MRKLAFHIFKNKGAEQQRRYCAAGQRLCIHYIDSAIFLFPKPLIIFCSCKTPFVSDLVRNTEDRFSRDVALTESTT